MRMIDTSPGSIDLLVMNGRADREEQAGHERRAEEFRAWQEVISRARVGNATPEEMHEYNIHYFDSREENLLSASSHCKSTSRIHSPICLDRKDLDPEPRRNIIY